MANFKGHQHVQKMSGNDTNSWRQIVCGNCHAHVSAAVVAAYMERGDGKHVYWLLCPNCVDGSVLTSNATLYPPKTSGPTVLGLPSEVAAAYEEARRCLSVAAFTGCELVCRKILMHVAVEKGAKEGASFATYLRHLESAGYVTPPMKSWVTLIRSHGNAATHKLETPGAERAESTLMFTAELLRLVYEMEHMARKYAPPLASEEGD